MALRQTTYQIRLADGRTLACDPTGSPVFYPGSRLEGRSAGGHRPTARSAPDCPRSSRFRRIHIPARPNDRCLGYRCGRIGGSDRTGPVCYRRSVWWGAFACAARIPDRVRRVALSGAWDRSRTSNSLAIWSPARMAASLAAPAPFIAALTLSGVKGTERSRTPTASNTALEIGPGQARSALGSLPSSRASPTSRPRSRWSLPRAYGSPML